MRVYFVCNISMSLFLIVPQVVCVKHKQVIHIGGIEQITEKQVWQLYTCVCIFYTQYCKHLECKIVTMHNLHVHYVTGDGVGAVRFGDRW